MKKLFAIIILVLAICSEGFGFSKSTTTDPNKWVNYFNVAGEWVDAENEFTEALTTEHCRFFGYKAGDTTEIDANSFEITMSSAAVPMVNYLVHTLPAAIDVSNCDLEISFWLPDANGPELQYVYPMLYNTAGTSYIEIGHITTATSYQMSVNGWHFEKFNLGHGTVTGTATLAQILADVKQIKFKVRAYNVGGNVDTKIVFDMIRFVPRTQTKALLIMTFDDGMANDYIAAEYLYNNGIKANFFVNTASIGVAGRLSLAQCQQMQEWGHLIANHTAGHSYMYDIERTPVNLPPHAVIADITAGSQWLKANGFYKGSRIYAVPGGSNQFRFWAYSDKLTLNPTYDLMRLTDSVGTNRLCDVIMHPDFGLITYTDYFDDPTNSNTLVNNANVLAMHSIISIGGHTSPGTTWISGGQPSTAFQTLVTSAVTQINAGLLESITYDELVYGRMPAKSTVLLNTVYDVNSVGTYRTVTDSNVAEGVVFGPNDTNEGTYSPPDVNSQILSALNLISQKVTDANSNIDSKHYFNPASEQVTVTSESIQAALPDTIEAVTNIEAVTRKIQFSEANDLKVTLDGEQVTTDSASREASKATGFATSQQVSDVNTNLESSIGGISLDTSLLAKEQTLLDANSSIYPLILLNNKILRADKFLNLTSGLYYEYDEDSNDVLIEKIVTDKNDNPVTRTNQVPVKYRKDD